MLPASLRNSHCNWACSGEMREACLAGLWAVPAASHSQLLAANHCCPWAGERVSAARGGILHPCLSVWSVYWQTKGHLQSKGKGMTVSISKQDTDLPSQKREPNQPPPRQLASIFSSATNLFLQHQAKPFNLPVTAL